MIYQVRFIRSTGEECKKLPPEIRKAARECLRELAKNPFLGQELERDLSGFRSYRFMRWRIVYKVDVEAKIVTVRDIGPRGTVYERFAEQLARMGSDDME